MILVCKTKCATCNEDQCDFRQGICDRCGETFRTAELFQVDGMDLCMRCKLEVEDGKEIPKEGQTI